MKRVPILVLVLALGLVLAGCGKGASTSATGFTLRIHTAGGFLPPGADIVGVPQFTLTSDGRIVTSGPMIELYPGPALPNMLQRTITRAGIDAIIAEARKDGLFGPDKHYDNDMVADAGTTFFIIEDGDERHQISAYALGGFEIGDNASEEAKAERAKLQHFIEQIGDLDKWLPEGSLGEEESFEIEAMRVVALDSPGDRGDGVKAGEMDWPLSPLATFGEESGPIRCGVVTGADLERLLPSARKATQITDWKSDGKKYNVLMRPQLPDESGCEVPSRPQS